MTTECMFLPTTCTVLHTVHSIHVHIQIYWTYTFLHCYSEQEEATHQSRVKDSHQIEFTPDNEMGRISFGLKMPTYKSVVSSGNFMALWIRNSIIILKHFY